MSNFFNCIQNAMNGGMVPKGLGKKAQQQWQQISQAMVNSGSPIHVAQNQAAVIVVNNFRRQSQRSKWRKLAALGMTQHQKSVVSHSASLTSHMTREMDLINFEARSLERRMNGRILEFLREHRPNWMGKQKDPAKMLDVLKGLHGQPAGSPKAQSFAGAIHAVQEDLRKMLNETGYSIGKLDTYGLNHRWDRQRILKATYAGWKAKMTDRSKVRLAWHKIENPNTGLPYQASPSAPLPSAADQDEFLQAVFQNFEYGKGTNKAVYGRQGNGFGGEEHRRVLHFEDAESWAEINKDFGSTDPFNTIVEHIADMSREVAMARHYGPNARLGAEYVQQLVQKEARDRGVGGIKAAVIAGNTNHALRMQRVMMPGGAPPGPLSRLAAVWLSSTRKVVGSALLDRAIVVSVPSDMNSTRLAAQAVGMNPENIISTYVNLMADAAKGGGLTTDDLARQQWIADSYANPSATMSRYVTEVPAFEWAEILSNTAMRVQGLQAHTDNLKLAFQFGFAGHMMGNSGKRLADVDLDLQARMREHGITEADWDAFRGSGGHFTAGNGATFLNPLYWREATSLPPKEADRLFLKFQSLVETWTERAVPTGSVFAQGFIDPKAWGLLPGTLPFEVIKSGTMFKSFPAAFVMNQAHILRTKQGAWNKGLYIADLMFTSTIAGALAMQIGDLMLGRDPQDMTNEMFWVRAFIKGGGGGPVADIASTGAASWGGGFGSYLSGPMPQVAQDIFDLSVMNTADAVGDLYSGRELETGFAKDLSRFGKRYTPMGQTPVIGPALDRLFWDQLQIFIDPDSANALAKATKKTDNLYGRGTWWQPGDPLPSRGPDLLNAIGQ